MLERASQPLHCLVSTGTRLTDSFETREKRAYAGCASILSAWSDLRPEHTAPIFATAILVGQPHCSPLHDFPS